jgi:hypothetical protein
VLRVRGSSSGGTAARFGDVLGCLGILRGLLEVSGSYCCKVIRIFRDVMISGGPRTFELCYPRRDLEIIFNYVLIFWFTL